jgi:hypothetical protein
MKSGFLLRNLVLPAIIVTNSAQTAASSWT